MRRFGLALTLAACAGTDAAPGVTSTCAADSDCDDGLPCTVDRCAAADGARACAWDVAPGFCFVNGVCAVDGAARFDNPCQLCRASSPFLWSVATDGAACDDGSVCTEADRCSGGFCGGTPIVCDDANVCTRDACDARAGCVYPPLDGASCDDGARCTIDDRCAAGACVGVPDACDDGDPCTLDECNEVTGCGHTIAELPCDDGDHCTARDTCVDGHCRGGATATCDDGNACTIDHCAPARGCVNRPTEAPCCIGAVSACDDGDPCTDDLCDAATAACAHVDNDAACDDGDPCTSGDTCAAGACVPGPGVACSDGNDCTVDSCHASFPGLCLHEPRAGDCDDGLACTTGDGCVEGACRGDTSGCACVPSLAADGVKLTAITLGASGDPGEGVDVDQDPATCAPSPCTGGVDNTLSIIAGLANPSLADAVARGEVQLVIEIGDHAADPFEIAVYQARLAAPGCNVQTQTCSWLVDKAFLDAATCEPIAKLAATLDGTHLVAGGPGTRLPFEIPVDGASLQVVVANLRLEAEVTLVGDQVTALRGVLGGAVPKQTLLDGLASLPEGALPISSETAIGLVDSLVQNDIDTDQDGVKDAASIGIKLQAIDAILVGVTP